MHITEKIKELKKILTGYQPLIIALSGGMDSSFLTFMNHHVPGNKKMAISILSDFTIKKDIEFAKEFTLKYQILFTTIKINPLSSVELVKNDKERCYYCKKLIFTKLLEYAKDNNFKNVADGTVLNDEDDYRPGKKALKDLGIVSPLYEAGFTKELIKNACFLYDFSIPFQSNSCLATRIPYGIKITPEIITMIEQGELLLQEMGFHPVRLRYHHPLARIELTEHDSKRLMDDPKIKKKIIEKLKEIGFFYITLDIEGFRSGSLNSKFFISEKSM